MSEMKMSEVFDLPVSVEGFNLNDGYIGGAGGMTISNFDCEFESTLSISMAEHAAHAINNHGRMVEEIAELKGLVDNLKKDRSSAISLMSKSWRHGAEDRPMILTSFVEMANRQFESLAKLNQEGEE